MRQRIWHGVVHLAVALICFTRVLAYSPLFRPPHDSPGPMFLTDEGRFLWAYVAAWAVVGCLALWDGLRCRFGWALPTFIGIMTVWGLSYIGAWVYAAFDTTSWMTGALYLGVSVIVLGFYRESDALRDRVCELEDRERARITAPIEEVSRASE